MYRAASDLSLFAPTEKWCVDSSIVDWMRSRSFSVSWRRYVVLPDSLLKMWLSVSDWGSFIFSTVFSFEEFFCFVFLQQVQQFIFNELEEKEPMQMTEADETSFHAAEFCWIVEELLDGDKVRDHDHITGK